MAMIKKTILTVSTIIVSWIAVGLVYLVWYDHAKWSVALTNENAQEFYAEITNNHVDVIKSSSVFAASNSSKSKNLVCNLWFKDNENNQIRAILIYLDDFRVTRNVKISSEPLDNWWMPKATKKIYQEGFSIIHHFPVTVLNSRVLPKGNAVIVKGISANNSLKFSNKKFRIVAYMSEIQTIDFLTEPNSGIFKNVLTRFDFFHKHFGSLMFMKDENGQQLAIVSYMVNDKDKYTSETVKFIANQLKSFDFSKL